MDMDVERVSGRRPTNARGSGKHMPNDRLVGVDYVMGALGVSKTSAYRIIRRLNAEIVSKGGLVIAGRVSQRYLEYRYLAPNEVGKPVLM